jgi:D-alanyl-D-alanine carboxypeptidase (penicillin-binding protein 5/6)
MKTSRLIGLIIIVILGIHVVAIGLFYFRNSKSGGETTASPVSGELPAAEETAAAPPPLQETVKKHANPLFGTHFIYRYAVQGNLPAVPETAEVRAGFLVNLNTRQVLWTKNPREGYPIASMTKMMTLLLAAEAMAKNPALNHDTPVKVTLASSKVGGSQVWLDPRETFPFGELLKAVAIKSANDAAYLVAEYVNEGDVAGFVGRMNQRARELRMPSTAFVNPYGLKADDGKNSVSSAEGMAILAEYLLEYPDIMELCSTRLATFRPDGARGQLQLTNTNRLLGQCPGVDGLKTGYIKESGYCITVTCLRGDKRMVAVIIGAPSISKRNTAVRKLLDWGYRRDVELNDPLNHLSGEAKDFGKQVSSGTLPPPPPVLSGTSR